MTINASFQDAVEHTWERRRDFFRLIFADGEGFVCVGYKSQTDRSMRHHFFRYPEELSNMLDDIDQNANSMSHVYFCPNIFLSKDFKKNNVKASTTVWADLDTCHPRNMLVKPSIVIRTSEARFQALWRLEQPVKPEIAEGVSLKVAYFHKGQGADTSGWDLTQLLRVPYTPNYKYKTAPMVVVTDTNGALYRPDDFSRYPDIEALKKVQVQFPHLLSLLRSLRSTYYSAIVEY